MPKTQIDKLANSTLWQRIIPRRLGETSKELEELQREYRNKTAQVQEEKHLLMKNQVSLYHKQNKNKNENYKEQMNKEIEDKLVAI